LPQGGIGRAFGPWVRAAHLALEGGLPERRQKWEGAAAEVGGNDGSSGRERRQEWEGMVRMRSRGGGVADANNLCPERPAGSTILSTVKAEDFRE